MEIFNSLLFYVIAFLLLFSAIAVIFMPKIVYNVIFAVFAFLLTGAYYFMLNATFIGICQVAIYAIAISILLLFAIILTPFYKEKDLWITFKPRILLSAGAIFVIFICVILIIFEYFQSFDTTIPLKQSVLNINTINLIAENIFEKYIFAYETLSLLLLITIIGIGAIICKHKLEEK